MGKHAAVQCPIRGVKTMGRMGEKEKGRLFRGYRIFFYSILFFVSFVCFTGNSPAQDIGQIRLDIASANPELIRNALIQINNLRTEPASRLALPALHDPNEIVRATAATAVIYLPRPEAVRVLLPLLNDKAPFVRGEAAFALGEVGDASAVVPLIRVLQTDRATEVRSAAAAALGRTGDPAAVDALAETLKKKPRSDDDLLRRSAARSIGQIAQVLRSGTREAVTPQNFLPEKYKVKLAGESPGDAFPQFRAAVGVLTKTLENRRETDDTRREAAFALGAIGDPGSAPVLRAFLNGNDIYLAEICREALLSLDNRK